MTLFGTSLDGPQIAALVGLLATLALWLIVLGRERNYVRWFRQWGSDRKSRRHAGRGVSAPPSDRERRGPWG